MDQGASAKLHVSFYRFTFVRVETRQKATQDSKPSIVGTIAACRSTVAMGKAIWIHLTYVGEQAVTNTSCVLNRIQEWLDQRKLSLQQLERITCLPHDRLCRYVQQKQELTLQDSHKIAVAMGLSIADLLPHEPPQDP